MRSASDAIAACLLAALLAGEATAQEVRLVVQRSALAGWRYYDAGEVVRWLVPGEPLDLVREPDNRHDPNAIRVEWHGYKLGYVPRKDNAALAWALDQGEHLEARIVERTRLPVSRRRIEFEVFAR